MKTGIEQIDWRNHPAFDDEHEAAACLAAVQDCLRAMQADLAMTDEPYPLPQLPVERLA